MESDRQFFAAQNMEMQMLHGLACVLAHVGDDAVAVFQPLLLGQLCDDGEADTILISGMGGALIRDILMKEKDKTISAGELVLSPQSEIYLVRRCLHELGFFIDMEKMVFDMGKYYVVIRAVRKDMMECLGQHNKEVAEINHSGSIINIDETYDEADYVYGKYLIAAKNDVFAEFLAKEKERMEKVMASLKKSGMSDEEISKQKIIAEYDLLLKTICRMQ